MTRLRRFGSLVSVLALASIALAPGQPAAAAPTRWATCGRFVEVTTYQKGTLVTRLNDVAQVSTTDAWAVGVAHPERDEAATVPVILRWDGLRWNEVAVPVTGHADLEAVAARASDDVWAVGTVGARPLVLHWDGARWTRMPLGTDDHAQLSSVGPVPGRPGVWVAGARNLPDGSQQAFAARWNGTAWHVTPTPTFRSDSSLLGVVSFGKVAFATGFLVRSKTFPLALRWNGHRWSPVAVPHPTRFGRLFGIAGTGPTAVWTAGMRQGHGIVLRWEDGAFRTVLHLDRQSQLRDVAVPARGSIWAVGGVLPAGGDVVPIAVHRSSAGWTVDPAPRVSGPSEMSGVDGTPHDLWGVAPGDAFFGTSHLLHRC